MTTDHELEIRTYRESDQNAVVALWRECELVRPWNDPVQDIQRKLGMQHELFLVGTVGGRLVATVMAGYEEHRGWINYLAVANECRNRGFGRRLMAEAEARLRATGCPKINLQIRSSNVDVIEFYKSIGFSLGGCRREHGQAPDPRLTQTTAQPCCGVGGPSHRIRDSRSRHRFQPSLNLDIDLFAIAECATAKVSSGWPPRAR